MPRATPAITLLLPPRDAADAICRATPREYVYAIQLSRRAAALLIFVTLLPSSATPLHVFHVHDLFCRCHGAMLALMSLFFRLYARRQTEREQVEEGYDALRFRCLCAAVTLLYAADADAMLYDADVAADTPCLIYYAFMPCHICYATSPRQSLLIDAGATWRHFDAAITYASGAIRFHFFALFDAAMRFTPLILRHCRYDDTLRR